MSKNSINFNINFDSQFNSSQILKGLEEVRKKMGALSTNEQIFKGVDKEFVRLKALLSTLDTQSKNIGNAAGLNTYQRTLEKVRLSASKISSEMIEISKNETNAFNFKDIADAQKKIQQLEKALSQANTKMGATSEKVKSSLKGMGISADEEALNNYVKQLSKGESLLKIMTQDITRQATEIQKMIEKRKEFNKMSSNIRISANDEIAKKGTFSTKTQAEAGVSSSIKDNIAIGLMDNSSSADVIKAVQIELKLLGVELNENSKVWDNISKTYEQLLNKQRALNAEFEPMKQSTMELENNMNKLAQEGVDSVVPGFQDLNDELIQDANNVQDLGGKLETANDEMQNLDSQEALDKVGEEATKASIETEALVDAQEDSVSAQREANTQQQALNQAFDRVGNAVKNVLSIGNAWRLVNRYIRQTFQDVQRLDEAFASIAMVTNYQVSDLWEQYDQYSELANRLGQTTEGAIKSSALFYQQGKI